MLMKFVVAFASGLLAVGFAIMTKKRAGWDAFASFVLSSALAMLSLFFVAQIAGSFLLVGAGVAAKFGDQIMNFVETYTDNEFQTLGRRFSEATTGGLVIFVMFIMLAVVVMYSVYRIVWNHVNTTSWERQYGTISGPKLERMMTGSQLQALAGPNQYQFSVGISIGGKWYYSGQGVAIEGGKLITAAHVVEYAEVTMIKNERGSIEIPIDRWERLHETVDLVCCTMTEQERSRSNLSLAKLAKVGVQGKMRMPVEVQCIAEGRSEKSFGFISRNDAFGMVSYSGSTKLGFSGAPYYLNKTVFGIHVAAESTNVGYEASFIAMLLARHSNLKLEDSADWLIDQAMRDDDYGHDWDGDRFAFRINGRYFDGDQTLYDRIQDRRHRQETAYRTPLSVSEDEEIRLPLNYPKPIKKPAPATRVSFVAETAVPQERRSLNLRRPVPVSASAAMESDDSDTDASSTSIQKSKKTKPLSLPQTCKNCTGGQESMRALLKPVFDSTAKSMRKQNKRQKSQALKKEVQQLRQQLEATLHGKQISDQQQNQKPGSSCNFQSQ